LGTHNPIYAWIDHHHKAFTRLHHGTRTNTGDRQTWNTEKSVDLSYPPFLTTHRPFPKATCAILGRTARTLIQQPPRAHSQVGSRFQQDGQVLKIKMRDGFAIRQCPSRQHKSTFHTSFYVPVPNIELNPECRRACSGNSLLTSSAGAFASCKENRKGLQKKS
jgi:hypothetical protein